MALSMAFPEEGIKFTDVSPCTIIRRPLIAQVIPENGQNGQNLARKPPVPQRCISLDAGNGGGGGGGMGNRPSLPRNKKPQLTAEQLRPVHHQSVPNFNQNRNDMGKKLRSSVQLLTVY